VVLVTNEELVDRIQHGINAAEYMEQLYMRNKGFIYNVIRKYRYACQSDYGSIPIIEMDELMHEAYFGLVEAAERYKPDQGANFLTYAAHWINQVVKRFLDNSGQVIRVPVHKQEEIYKYNQARAYYLNRYNREPNYREYASWIGISPDGVKRLERFMFQGAIRSLDETVPGGEDDNLSFADVVPAEVDIEEDVVEKLAAEQLREELWDIVAQVLKDRKKIQIFRMRYINNMTLEQIGEKLHVSRAAIDQSVQYGIKMLRRNSWTRNLGVELGIWSREIPLDAKRVKRWAMDEKLRSFLKGNDLKYAVNMGWVDSGMM
jgi:RNA polymerase primary sigma factor